MGNLVAAEFISLDGVIQAPGNEFEDPTDFAHGGWTKQYFADHAQAVMQQFADTNAFLFGRKTYEIFANVWPGMGDSNPLAAKFNNTPKYVVSQTLGEATWQGTEVMAGELSAEIQSIKDATHGNITLIGSSQLAHSLLAAQLIDELQLMVHPVVLGSGKRLFGATDQLQIWDLKSVNTTESGLVNIAYRKSAA